MKNGDHRAGRSWRRKRLALLGVLCLAGGLAHANPTGPVVANGQVGFSTAGNVLTVTNSPGSIVNWKSFSIGNNEVTRFLQQSSASSVLNRVSGINPSSILGALQSNGRVFLINPNGIMFGANAQVDVAGLVVSTLNMSDADFLVGRYRFTEIPGAAGIKNEGSITTNAGGIVYLVAPDIKNSGIIRTPKGEILLAAGKSVELVDTQTPDVRVQIDAPDNQAVNLGQLLAEGGRIGIYSGLIQHSGIVNADTAVVGKDGKIVFKATKDVTLEAGSQTTANGPQGGSVMVQSDTGATLVSGTVEAKGTDGKGGTVQILGNQVGLIDNASVNASGQTGGGTVLVGGDFHGANPNMQNATATYVGLYATISADAIQSGNGGNVAVWADDWTRFYGSITARGGAQGGDGGFSEVSGKQNLTFAGSVNLGAPAGISGTLLLDPDDLYVGVDPANGATQDSTDPFAATGGLDFFVLASSLTGNASYTLTADHDVIFNAGVTFGSQAGNTVSVTATNAITSTGYTVATSGGALTLNASTMALGPLDTGVGLLTINNSGAASQSGAFAGSGGLTKTGAGTLTLSQTNTYTGLTTVSAGTLAYGASDVISTGAVTVDGATAVLDLGASNSDTVGTVTVANGGSISGTGTSSLTSTGTFEMQSGSVSAILAGTGIALNKTTVGTVALSGANTYTGLTTVSAGTLNLNTTGADAIAGNLTVSGGSTVLQQSDQIANAANVVVSGGTLDLATFNDTVNGVQLTSGNIGGSGGTLSSATAFDMQAGSVSAILGGAVGLNKTGGGTVTLSGANTYTGATAVDAGTLVIGADAPAGSAGALGNASSAVTVGSVGNSASLLVGGAFTVGRDITVQDTTGQTVSLGGDAAASSSFSGAVTLNQGTTLTAASGGTATFSGIINDGTGSFVVTKSGAGTVVLSNANTYDGGTAVSTGALNLQNGAAAGTGTVTVSNGAAVQVQGGITVANALTLNGTGASNDGALRNIGGSNTWSGAVIDTTNAVRINADAGALTLSNTIDNGGLLLTMGGAGDTSASNVISGIGGLTKDGGGTVTLSGANTYTGATIVNGGTLKAGVASVANTSGAFGNNSAVTMANASGVTLDITGFATQIGSLTGGGTTGGNVTLGAATLTVGGDNTSPAAYAGVISGTGAIDKIGTGTLTLSGANTYTGLTTISSGTLKLGAAGDASNTPLGTADAGTTVAATGAALDLNGFTLGTAEALTLNGTGVSSGGALTNSSATAATYSGLITLGSDSSIIASSGNIILSNAGTITGSGFGLTLGGTSGANSLASIIGTGAGTLTKAGSGTWTLSGASTYTGLTTVSAGTLAYGASDVISTGAVTVDGTTAVLDLGASNSDTVGTVTVANGGSISGTGTSSLTSTGTFEMQSGSVSAILAGTGIALNKTTVGTVTLSGANSYTGTTTISGGTLAVSGASGAAGTGTIAVGANTLDIINGATVANPVTVSGGTLANSAGAGTLSTAGVTLNGNSNVSSTASGLTISAVIGESGGSFGITDTGTGTVTLSGVNTYTGATTINSGSTLALDATGTIADSSGVANSGTFTIAADKTIDSMTGAGSTSLGGNTLTIGDASNTSGTYSGVISGTGGITTGGAGTLTLGGVNTYTGTTTIGAGSTLALDATGTIADSSGVANSGTFTIAADKTIDSMTDAGSTSLGGNTLTIGDASNTSGTYSGVISGTGGITKAGTGTLTLSGTNTYSGSTTVSAGVIDVQNDAALGTSAGATTVASGAAVQIDGSGLSIAEPFTVNGTGVSGAGALRNLANSNTLSGAITLGAGGARINSDAGTLTLSGGIDNGGNTLTLGGAGDTTVNTTAISGTGGLTKDGNGTLTLGVGNSYSGATSITAGTVVAEADGALGSAGGTTTVSNNATIGFSGGFAYNTGETIVLNGTGDSGNSRAGALDNISGANSFAGTLTLVGGGNSTIGATAGSFSHSGSSIGASDFTYNPASGTTITESGVVSGAGTNVIKNGAGTLVLSGANTYDGSTTLNTGTLRATSSAAALGAGTLTLAGGTLELANDSGLNFARDTTVTGSSTIVSDRLTSGAAVTHTLGTLSIGAQTLTVNPGANVSSGTAGLTFGATTLTGGSTFDVASGALLTLGNVSGAGQALTIAGAGSTDFSGTVNAANVALNNTAGTVSFQGNTTITSGMTTASNAFDISFTGSNNSIAGTTTFGNTGTLTLGDQSTDITAFTDGVVATAPSSKSIAGTITATTGASMINLGMSTVSVTDGAAVGGAATGAITLGDATLADSKQLTVGTGISNAINLGAVVGNAGAGAETLLINTTGVVNVAGAVGATGNALDQLTVTQSGGTTFASTVDAKNVTVTDTADGATVAFQGNLKVANGMTVANGGADNYNVSITGGANSIAGTTTFANGGTLTLGDQSTDSTTFAGGVVATAPSSKSIAGTIAATTGASVINLGMSAVSVTDNAVIGGAATGAITLGDATLADGKQLTVGTGISNAINLGAVVGNAGAGAETLLINTTGVVNVAGAVGATGNALDQLTVTQSGGTTFASTVDAKNVTVTDTAAGQTVAFQGAVTATNLTVGAGTGAYNVSLTGTGDTITNAVTFANTGTLTLGQAGGTQTYNGGITATAPSSTTLLGTIAASDDALVFGPVTLGANTVLNTNAVTNMADITTGAVTGSGFDLSLTTGHVAGADISGTSLGNVGTLTIGNVGTSTFSGTVSTNTAVTIADAVTAVNFSGAVTAPTLNVAAGSTTNYDVALTGTGDVITNPVTFNNGGALTLGQAGGTQTYNGGITATAPSSTTLLGTIATSNDALTFGPVILGADTILSSGSGTINLTNTVNADSAANNRALALNSTGSTILGGVAGGAQALGSLTTNAGGTTQINGGAVTTSGAQIYNDAVTLGADTTFNGANIAFNNTLNSSGANRALAVNDSGTTTFNSAVGGTLALSSITTDAPGATAINGGSVVTTGGQSYNDAVMLGADTTLNGVNVAFNNTLDSSAVNRALVINDSGTTTFGGVVGGTLALSSLTTDAAGATAINGGLVTTTGAQSYNDAVTLNADATLISTASGNVTFGSTLNSLNATARNLTVNTAGATTFAGAVGGSNALASLSTDAPGSTAVNGGSVTTTGTQTFGDAVRIGADTSFNGVNVAFNNTLDSSGANRALTVNDSGTTVLGGTVGGTLALSSVTTDAPGMTAINGGSVMTTGGQTYGDAVTVGADATLTSTASGNVAFAGTLNSANATARNLTANTGGVTSFAGAVGAANALASLTTDAPGSTAVNGGSVTTTGAQTYNDTVTLGADTTLTGANVSVNNTLNSSGANRALAVNDSGTTTFNGAVGGTLALSSITTDVPGTAAINGGSVITTGTQTYNDAVTLGADTTLNGVNVAFNNTLDSSGANRALTVNDSGTTTFGGGVGNTLALTSLLTDAAGTTAINAGNVTTTAAQNYNDPVTVGANTVLNAGSANVSFAGTVDGPASLTVNSTGTTTFSANVGGVTPLAGLATNAGGTTTLQDVATAGAQTYGDDVVLKSIYTTGGGAFSVGGKTAFAVGSTAVNAGSGNIAFNGPVDGANNLTLTNIGTTSFGSPVGGVTPLATLTASAGNFSLPTAITATGNVTLTGAGSYSVPNVTTTGGGNIVLTSTGGTLSVNAARAAAGGDITFTADEIELTGAANSIAGSGNLRLQPQNPGLLIEIGGSGGTAALDITNSEITRIATGFPDITIGQDAGTGAVTFNTSSFNDNLTVVGGSIAANGALTSAGKSVTLTANNGAISSGTGAGVNVVASTLNANAAGDIALNTQVDTINASSAAGSITMVEADNVTLANVSAPAGDVDITSTTGNLALDTIAAGTTNNKFALLFAPSGAITDANGDAINVTAANIELVARDGIDLDTKAFNSDVTPANFPALQPSRLNAGTITAVNTGVADIGIRQTGNADILNVATASDQTTSGNITIAGTDSLAVNTVSAGGLVYFGTAPSITTKSVGGNMLITLNSPRASGGLSDPTVTLAGGGLVPVNDTGHDGGPGKVAVIERFVAPSGAVDYQVTGSGTGDNRFTLVVAGQVPVVGGTITITAPGAITDYTGMPPDTSEIINILNLVGQTIQVTGFTSSLAYQLVTDGSGLEGFAPEQTLPTSVAQLVQQIAASQRSTQEKEENKKQEALAGRICR